MQLAMFDSLWSKNAIDHLVFAFRSPFDVAEPENFECIKRKA